MTGIDTVALMAATLRAGKAGRRADAWAEALSEAVFGYALVLANRATIAQQIGAILPATADATPTQVVPVVREPLLVAI
jgi:hypothetical protein